MFRVIFCMVPSGKGQKFAKKQIKYFSSKLDSSVFVPHVTYHASVYKNMEEAISIFQNTLQHVDKISLQPKAIEFSNLYTKSLFLSFYNNDDISTLSKNVQQAYTHKEQYLLRPHLSLTYTNNPIEHLIPLVKHVELPDFCFEFKKFLAINTPLSVKSRKDIESWKIISST